MAVHRADQGGEQEETGRDLSRLGDIASTGSVQRRLVRLSHSFCA